MGKKGMYREGKVNLIPYLKSISFLCVSEYGKNYTSNLYKVKLFFSIKKGGNYL
jgi:hypothetical protein